MKSRGVIYLVSGARSYLGELSTSLKSLRAYEPDLPVTVFSPFRLPGHLRCERLELNDDLHPLKQKVAVLSESPYDHTLFIDTDTTILGPLASIFGHLSEPDFALARSFHADWSNPRSPRLLELVHPTEYNTGVLLFDRESPAVQGFLQHWKDAVFSQDAADMWPGHNCDQTYFNRLISAGAPASYSLQLGELPNAVWNVRGPMMAEVKARGRWGEVRILHHRTRVMKLRKAAYGILDRSIYRRAVAKLRSA